LAYTTPAPTTAYSKSAHSPPRRSYIPHPKEYGDSHRGPYWGYVAAAIGGFLIAIQGVLIGLYGSYFLPLYWLLFALPPWEEGLFMLYVGILVFIAGWLAYHAPGHTQADAAVIWILVFLCGLTGTIVGFWVGSILAFVGAAHIWAWKSNQVGGPGAIRRALGSG
jgi:hypothetical protein